MVHTVENVFCISDIWERFCFPSQKPSECLGQTEALEGIILLVHQAALGVMTVTTEQDWGPAHH